MSFESTFKETVIGLEKRNFSCTYCLSEHALVTTDHLQELEVFISRKLTDRMWRYSIAWSCPVWLRQKIFTPKDWWQHFKARWFPFWALDRWPVEHDVYDIYEGFPEVAMQMGHRRMSLVFYNQSFEPGPAQKFEKRDEPECAEIFKYLYAYGTTRFKGSLRALPDWVYDALRSYVIDRDSGKLK